MPTADLDPRRNAIRPDLADARLVGRVEAGRFIAGSPGQIIRPLVGMRGAPGFDKSLVNEAILGERVSVFDVSGGPDGSWAWVQLARDGYVGYVPAEAVGRDVTEPTHRVSAIGTWLYPEASIKAPPLAHVVLGSEIAVRHSGERFSELVSGEFIITRHITEASRFTRDFVAVAERFLGTPYLWGGRSRLGLDCSGLVQIALVATGAPCPRDSDMQQADLGSEVLIPADLDGLDRGDLVFWPGHVGIMLDGVMLLHANAHHMSVAAEPLVTAAARIRRDGSAIAAIKRLAGSTLES
ncbi:MAG: C40 family peptidase [Hyphomicrobiaceae bacterium]